MSVPEPMFQERVCASAGVGTQTAPRQSGGRQRMQRARARPGARTRGVRYGPGGVAIYPAFVGMEVAARRFAAGCSGGPRYRSSGGWFACVRDVMSGSDAVELLRRSIGGLLPW